MISQLQIDACDPNQSVVIEACAGSGKTWLLVSRMIRLLLDGVKPSEILAITFTRKAAREMSVRLNELLVKLATSSDEVLLDELMQRGLSKGRAIEMMPKARGLLEYVQADPISVSLDTFHGWFIKLLQVAPIHSSIPQGLQLREDQKRLQRECMAEWWLTLAQKDKVKSSYEYLVNQLDAHQVEELLFGNKSSLNARAEWEIYKRFLLANQRALESAFDDYASTPESSQLQAWCMDVQQLESLYFIAETWLSGTSAEKANGQGLHAALSQLKVTQDYNLFAEEIKPFFLTKEFRIRSFKPTNELKDSLAESQRDILVDRLTAAWSNWAEALSNYYQWSTNQRAKQIYRAWLVVHQDILDFYQKKKIALKVQDFSDIESYAQELMSKDDLAAYIQLRLDHQYKHILIDEFQDTNPLQWQILMSWLSSYSGDASRPSVFLVGDPKQSIYRFRRADVRLFQEAKAFLINQFNAVYHPFNLTRRNSPKIIDAVNSIFTLDILPAEYKFEPQRRNPGAPATTDGFTYLLPLVDVEKPEVSDRRRALAQAYISSEDQLKILRYEKEARQVGCLIHSMVSSEQAQWKDFLILIRSRANLPSIERTFRAMRLPYESFSQGGLLHTLEADDLISLLKVLVTPSDDLSMAQVLKSPIFSLTDDDLTNLILLKDTLKVTSLWEVMRAKPGVWTFAFEKITVWSTRCQFIPVHDFLDYIYQDAQIRSSYARSVTPTYREQVLSNLDTFLKLALSLDGGRYPSLTRFIRELEVIKQGELQESPDEGDSLSEESHLDGAANRIQIMTIHSAKGLESRFVIVMNTNTTKVKQDYVGVRVDWQPKDIAPRYIFPYFNLKPLKDNLCGDLKSQELEIELIENWNMLYVALTRAKEGLYISGIGESPNDSGSASWYARAVRAGIPSLPFDLVDPIVGDHDLTNQVPAELIDFRVEFAPLCGEQEYADDDEMLGIDQLKVIDQGVLFHALMEYIGRKRIYRMEDLPNESYFSQLFSVAISDVVPLLAAARAILQSEQTKYFFDPSKIKYSWEELPLLREDGRMFRLDRLIHQGDALIILDYKLSIPQSDHSLMAQYREQLNNYRELVTKQIPDLPIQGHLVSATGQSMRIY